MTFKNINMIGISFYFTWEVFLIVFLQNHLQFLTPLFYYISDLGDQIFIIIISSFIYWIYDKEKGKLFLIILFAGIMTNVFLKNLVIRRRPYFDHEAIRCIRPAEYKYPADDVLLQGFSFPSLHATNVTIIFSFIMAEIRKNWVTAICCFLIFLVCLSRLFLGVHYPTDVIAGVILGIIIVFVMYYVYNKVKEKWKLFLVLCVLGLIGFLFTQNFDYFRAYGILIGLCASILIEEKYVNFKNTRNVLRAIIRLFVGLMVIGVFYILIMMFLPKSGFINSIAAVILYALCFIVALGLYPMIFKKFDKYFDETSSSS